MIDNKKIEEELEKFQKMLKTKFILICMSIIFHLESSTSWLERKAEGWAWYEDGEKQEHLQQKVDLETEVSITGLSATQIVENMRKETEEKLAQAILEPTEKNVEVYMREQKKMINQSSAFSNTWAKVLLKTPELDATTEFPVSQYGIHIRKKTEKQKLESLIHNLRNDYGLFFFYEGRHPDSHAFADVARAFAKKYKMNLIGISADGILIDGLTDNYHDNGSIAKIGVGIFPALFLVNPLEAAVHPISFGLLSLDQIERNIEIQFMEGN